MIILVVLVVILMMLSTLSAGLGSPVGFVFFALLLGSCIKSVSLYWRDIDFTPRWLRRYKSRQEQQD